MSTLRAGLLSVLVASVLGTGSARAQSDDGSVMVEVPQGDEYSDTDPSALTDFRQTLDPYGQWVDNPNYGTAWTPDATQVGNDFAPYDSAGSWDYVSNDYTWISDYAWGWVCFHYGRWAFAGSRWLWIPGRQYAGAWVDWRVGDDGMLGWSPLPPAWGWAGGTAYGLGFPSPEPWSFVTLGDVFAPGPLAHVTYGNAAVPLLARSHPYLHAQPTASGQPLAQAIMHGPPPSLLGIDLSHVQLAALGPSELRARQLAHPSTAVTLGARPAVTHVVRTRPPPQRSVAPATRAPARGRR